MTTRRISAPALLYTQSPSGRWLTCLTATLDAAAAGLCRLYWQRGRQIALQPVRVRSTAHRAH